MARARVSTVGEQVSELLNLSVTAAPQRNPGETLLRVKGVERPHGFAVRAVQGLAVADARLELDSLAGSLLSLAARATDEQWNDLHQAQRSLAEAGIRVEVLPDGPPRDPAGLVDLSISARTVIEWDGNRTMAPAAAAAAVISMVLVLLPTEEVASVESSDDDSEYAFEGGVRQGTYNRYERSRSNRAIAILVHGTRCAACGFDFGETYGDLATGYVEIHHRTPVHLMGERRTVDPRTELVPLCANCHRVVHRIDPPIPVEELARHFDNDGEVSMS